jgi:hypothetical protein
MRFGHFFSQETMKNQNSTRNIKLTGMEELELKVITI